MGRFAAGTPDDAQTELVGCPSTSSMRKKSSTVYVAKPFSSNALINELYSDPSIPSSKTELNQSEINPKPLITVVD